MRWLARLLGFALGLAVVAWGNARIARHVAMTVGSGLAHWVSPLSRPARPAEARGGESVDVCSGAGDVVVRARDHAAGNGRRRAARRRVLRRRARKAVHAVLVQGATVLQLVRSSVRPRGKLVPADGTRPAGILLQGVSGLGVGLEDGDVLTSVAGAPARDIGDVIGAVVAARGRSAPSVSGIFWRHGEPWRLVVQQPYPQRAPSH